MARVNQVGPPPLQSPIVDASGKVTSVWAVWCRDLFARTSDKKSNSIDENKAAADSALESIGKSLVDINATQEDIITQINANISAIFANEAGIAANTQNQTSHQEAETAHGSNGNIVGFDDLATALVQGLVKQMAAVAGAVDSTVEITQTVVDAPLLYSQSSLQELIGLSRANKAGINQLKTDLNAVKTVLNNLIQTNKAAGQMAE